MQLVSITTKVVSSNPVHAEVYSIQTLCDKVCLTCGSSVKMRGDCSFFFILLNMFKLSFHNAIFQIAPRLAWSTPVE